MTTPQPEAACARCPHPLAEHGAGCTSGHFQSGPICHCPNDSDGRVATPCARVDCGVTPTHGDPFGQFFCPPHAGPGALAFDQIPGWVEA